MKEYKGLQARIGKDECHEAVDGDVGIASDYGGKWCIIMIERRIQFILTIKYLLIIYILYPI